jgi:hypothetical protein
MKNQQLQALLAKWPDEAEVQVQQHYKDLEQPSGRQHSTRFFPINTVVGIGKIEQEAKTIGIVI